VKKKRPKYNQEAAIRGALRRAFSRSPIVQEVMAESRREVPRFTKDGSRHKKNWVQRQCQVCDEWVSTSKIAVDHMIPVISIELGKQDWNEFINRLWCDKANLQRICDPCHDSKTYSEKIDRLTKKYTIELDSLELSVRMIETGRPLDPKELRKSLTKYIAKKKSPGLEPIVKRAIALKERIAKYK
jgi:5-methylcytosine-specific restriction endonuclease McrA